MDQTLAVERSRAIFRLLRCVVAMVALLATGCATPATSSGPQVVVTAHMALLSGQVRVDAPCVYVRDESGVEYVLVWPPDQQAVVSHDSVAVTTGLVSGQQTTSTIQDGDLVQLGGNGQASLEGSPDVTVDPSCSGPYWVVGGEIYPGANQAP